MAELIKLFEQVVDAHVEGDLDDQGIVLRKNFRARAKVLHEEMARANKKAGQAKSLEARRPDIERSVESKVRIAEALEHGNELAERNLNLTERMVLAMEGLVKILGKSK